MEQHVTWTLTGTDLLLIAEALPLLEKNRRSNGRFLEPEGHRMLAKVSEVFALETSPRRGAKPERNPHDVPSALRGKFVDVKTAKDVLGKSPQMVRRYCGDGRLPGSFQKAPGTPWFIPTESLEALSKSPSRKENPWQTSPRLISPSSTPGRP
jgi:hypothetical protein